MKAVVIYGSQNSGKSTACFKLYELLLKRGGSVKNSTPAIVTDPSKPPKHDFSALIVLDGKTILITSEGDSGAAIAAHIQLAISLQVDFFILAIRKGTRYVASVSHLQNIINCHVPFITLPKPVSTQEQDKNETEVASKIASVI